MMAEYLVQILVATIPALITGVIAYLTASKKAKSEMETVKIQADKDLERLKLESEANLEQLEKENKAKFEDLEKQRAHDLTVLKEERASDLEYYKGQLEAQAKHDETMMQNEYVNRAMGDFYKKHDGDIFKMEEEIEGRKGNTQAEKAKQFAEKKKRG